MMDDSVASITLGDDIKPYKIHVSSKYLELTKKKLELTRLPHEVLLPRSRAWEQGTPKSEIEPLIDFWLEQYSWRTQETELNQNLAQFRAAITIPSSPTPFRIHFTHTKSPHANALPLLLLPTFPLTNLSLEPLLKPLTHPENPQDEQPFHIVAPSFPGLGFSDPFSAVTGAGNSVVEDTAQIFNSLMIKLGYEYYIASSTGSGTTSPAHVDYQLPRILASKHQASCIGIHLIDPPVQTPTLFSSLSSSLLTWTKYSIAKFFHAPIFGYTAADWNALHDSHRASTFPSARTRPPDVEAVATTPLLSRTSRPKPLFPFRNPNTLAYALCDSPVGLLSLVLHGLQRLSPGHSLGRAEIITLTQLAWLPGPEGAMRFWARAEEDAAVGEEKAGWSETRTAVTVFLGGGETQAGWGAGGGGVGYVCPAWAGARHNVVWAKRQEGRGGLVALERKEAVIEGIRGLAGEVMREDSRLASHGLDDVIVTDNDNVIAEENETVRAAIMQDEGDAEGEENVESPDTVVLNPAANL